MSFKNNGELKTKTFFFGITTPLLVLPTQRFSGKRTKNHTLLAQKTENKKALSLYNNKNNSNNNDKQLYINMIAVLTMKPFVDSGIVTTTHTSSSSSSFLARTSPPKTRIPKPSKALRNKFQVKSVLRIPLPMLTEAEELEEEDNTVPTNDAQQGGKWEETTCTGHSNVHMPRRQRSISEASLVQLLAESIVQEEFMAKSNEASQ